MQLVEHDAPQRAEQERRVGRRQDQRKLLRRRHENVRRIAALTLALGGGRVAGARLDADRQLHLRHRPLEVARHVDRQRLQRRDVERMQPALAAEVAAGRDEAAACVHWRQQLGSDRAAGFPPALLGEDMRGVRQSSGQDGPALSRRLGPHKGEGADRASGEVVLNSTRLGKNPANVLPAPVGAISSTERPARAFASSSSWCARGIQPRLANQRANGSGSVAMSARSRTVTRHS